MAIQALVFQDTTFDVIDKNGQPWLRSQQIGEALGYADDKSINRIYTRNSSEFTEQMTGVVNLTTSGNLQTEQRIFSLRGAHLIGMFARTKLAKEFRSWVLDILDQHTAQLPQSATETLIPSEQQTLSEIVHKKAAPYGENIGKAIKEIWSRLHNKFRITMYRQLPRTQLADAIVYVTGLTLRSVSAQPTPLPGLTPEQQDSINRQLDSLTNLWVFGSAAKGWAFNHLRVAFQVARWQDIPSAQFPAVQALIDSKHEAAGQFCGFVMEARDWFEKNVMGGGEPWTPAIKRKLAKELPQAVNIPARVDWHALAEQVRLAA